VPSSISSVYSHNQMYGSGLHLTSVVLSLCHDCYSPSPRIHCKTSQLVLFWSLSSGELGFCRDDNASICAKFGRCCYPLNEAQELAVELTCLDFIIWHLLPTFSGVRTEYGCLCSVLSFADPS
jgi:hypothetical protein